MISGQQRQTLGSSFNPVRNSLNFLRLVLAAMVVVSHAIGLGGFHIRNDVNQTSFGQIAVIGFFGISGFLIAGSAARNHAGRYLWQRFLRIFPAFWVCLIVTAFVFGVVAWISQHPAHCGLSCYFAAKDSPYSYVYRDFLLRMNQNGIAGTPQAGVAAGVWNGSTWTLFYEFLCYLILMVLAMAGLLRRRLPVLLLAAGLWIISAVITLTPSFDSQFNLFKNATAMNLLKFATVFMVGAAIYLYREKIPDRRTLALLSAALFVFGMYLPTGGHQPDFAFTVSDLSAPFIVYPLLWLGSHLPLQRIGHRNDYSYGIYIYGFPVAQLLLLWGVQSWGAVPFISLTLLATLTLAVGSWWIVEKRALSLKKVSVRSVFSPRTGRA
jgi:peptidoglycan/LPS O-acetylase OafA/YrhL